MSIEVDETGICPHCKNSNRFEIVRDYSNRAFFNIFTFEAKHNIPKSLRLCRCTSCGDVVIFLDERMIYPLGSTRPPCPDDVPKEISIDYSEACLVETISNKAAAALSRRCLQSILHERGIKKMNLNEEIDEAIKQLPSHLGSAIDAIRTIGNFAAHPIKYQNTGEIVEIEKGEAEWSLDVLEQLFDFYYVAPKKLQDKRDQLNTKLNAAGKPLLK